MTRFVHAPRGIHALETPAGAWTYAVPDGLGSVRIEAGSTASILGTQTYAPFGSPFSTHGTFEGGFGFTGEQVDGSGQVYLRARYYTPSLGAFTALDPFEGTVQRPMSLNGYAWVEGNPVSRTDPLGRVYLTFDDGPHPNDRRILDILDQFSAKATFFFHGSEIDSSTDDIIWRVAREGHRLGNHSWVHQDLTQLCVEEMVQSVLATRDSIVDVLRENVDSNPEYGDLPISIRSYISSVINHGTGLFRAPGGDFTDFQRAVLLCVMHDNEDGVWHWTSGQSCDESIGLSDPYLTYRWDVDPWDWYLNAFPDSVDNAQETLFSRIFNGWTRYTGPLDVIPVRHRSVRSNEDNILLHSNSNLTVETLPSILQELVSRGYTFDLLTPAWMMSYTERWEQY